MLVFGCAWKINFPENIFSWPCKMSLWPWKWFEVKIFTSNHFRVRCAKREIDREKEERSAHLNLSSLTHRAHSHASHSLTHAELSHSILSLMVVRSPSSTHSSSIAPRRSSANCTGLADHNIVLITPVLSITAQDWSHYADQAPIAPVSSIKQRSHWIWWIFFWVLFLLCSWTEKWYYIFVWKLRKCEQQVENVLCIVFLRTQPNTRKYFPKHFLKCN